MNLDQSAAFKVLKKSCHTFRDFVTFRLDTIGMVCSYNICIDIPRTHRQLYDAGKLRGMLDHIVLMCFTALLDELRRLWIRRDLRRLESCWIPKKMLQAAEHMQCLPNTLFPTKYFK
jgi:hypothetical protein